MDRPISYYAFEILYWCGIREGELLALTPADFDFDKAVLRISFQISCQCRQAVAYQMELLFQVMEYDKFFNVKGLVEEFKEFVRPKSIKERMEAKQKVVEKQKCEQVVNSTARREKDIAI